MRGRKPKPTTLKLLAGNPGHRPLNGQEALAPSELPDCPEHLDAEAQNEWQRITGILSGMGLLSCADRVGSERFPMTQEFLGQMLGVRRATVGEAAQELQERRLIRYSRGTMEIVDPGGLEEAACVCYRIVRDEYDKLMGAPAG